MVLSSMLKCLKNGMATRVFLATIIQGMLQGCTVQPSHALIFKSIKWMMISSNPSINTGQLTQSFQTCWNVWPMAIPRVLLATILQPVILAYTRYYKAYYKVCCKAAQPSNSHALIFNCQYDWKPFFFLNYKSKMWSGHSTLQNASI